MKKKIGILGLTVFGISVLIVSLIIGKSQLNVKGFAHSATLPGSSPIYLPIIINEPGYYVSSDGSDSNPGSFRQPWKTIAKAAQMLAPGDRLTIRGGTYNEIVNFQNSGTATQRIKITAYPGETPVIDGGFVNPEPGGFLLSIRGSYITVSGVEVRNSAYGGVYVYGNEDVVDNVYVHHTNSVGILISHGQNSTVENSRVWRAAFSNEYGRASSWGSGLSAARQGVTNATIRNNTIWESWGEGISSFEANGTVIENNTVHDSYSTNIYISDSTNVLCQRNFVYMNPSSYVYGYGDNVGIMMGDETYSPASANIKVINNIASGNHGNFWWWRGSQGGGMNNVLIAHNTFYNGSGTLGQGEGGVTIGVGNHQNVHFENNIVQQDGSLPAIATVSQPGITYSHNLWSKTPYSAASGSGDVIGDPKLAHLGASPFVPEWYTLSAGSPAINQGQTITDAADDYFGDPRNGSPDIGAVEFTP